MLASHYGKMIRMWHVRWLANTHMLSHMHRRVSRKHMHASVMVTIDVDAGDAAAVVAAVTVATLMCLYGRCCASTTQ